MIIVVCTDDAGLFQIAIQSRDRTPSAFGQIFKIFDQRIPTLGINENLFLIAHGAFHGDDGNPVVGDKRNAFFVNAVVLFRALQEGGIFPGGYQGNVYVDACESADHDNATFSFIEVLQAQLQPHYRTVVFGRNGTAGGLIPLPDSGNWRRAYFAAQA
jgi:hypothetical protein